MYVRRSAELGRAFHGKNWLLAVLVLLLLAMLGIFHQNPRFEWMGFVSEGGKGTKLRKTKPQPPDSNLRAPEQLQKNFLFEVPPAAVSPIWAAELPMAVLDGRAFPATAKNRNLNASQLDQYHRLVKEEWEKTKGGGFRLLDSQSENERSIAIVAAGQARTFLSPEQQQSLRDNIVTPLKQLGFVKPLFFVVVELFVQDKF